MPGGSNEADLDSALDALGYSVLEGIPVQISDRYLMAANINLNEVQALLANQPPNVEAVMQRTYQV